MSNRRVRENRSEEVRAIQLRHEALNALLSIEHHVKGSGRIFFADHFAFAIFLRLTR